MLPSSHSFVVTDRQMLLRIYFSSGVTSLATLRTWATSNADYLNARAAEIQYPVSTTVGWPLSSLHGEVMNNYQAQLVGYFTPPETGNYKFGLASDDHSVLFLSTDDKPANKKEIASVNGSNSQYQINEYTTQISSAIYLEAGKRYYIEAIWRDGTGGDGVTVVVQKPSDPDLPGTATAANLIPVECQSAYKSFGNVAITNQPVSFATMEGNPSSFTVGHAGVDGTLPYFYQWYRAGVPIPGANNYSYDFRPRLDDSDLDYYLVVSNYFSAATSAVVKVTVSKDVEKPTAVTAGSLLKQVVRVRFSEPVNTNDAVVLANYSLQSATGAAIPIYSAAMDTNNPATVVYLQTGPMTEYGTNSLTVQNVRDIAETPNTMDPATVSFVSYNFENAIRVNNTQTWGAYAEGTNITLTAGGSDIWGSSDQMTYVYKTVTGNFDLKYRGVSLTLANAWSKMGLMARESTNANSRNKFAGSSPATGQNTWTAQEREANGGTSQSTGDAGSPILVGLQPGASARPAVTYPNTWCRLQRIGNSFYYYYSSNGTDWTYWTVIDTDYVTAGPMPATMVVGLAATSHDTAKLADAVMAEFGPMVQGPLGFSVNLTNQTVNENMPVTFSVVASGQQPYGYEWLKNGAPIYDPTTFLPYTNSTYTVAQAPYADNGAVITCRLFNPYGTSMLSAPATLTVIRDTTAPTFALPMMPRVLATNVFTLQFSEILAQASAETTGNYVITGPGGTLSVLSAVLSPDGTKVTLTTAAPTPGATYTLTVNGVTDIAATPNPVAAGSKVNFYYGGSTTGIFAQRADGYVVMEAENATRLVTGTTPVDDWELRNTAAGFSGLGYMLVPSPSATSDGTTGGSALGPPTVGNGPRMEYDINFTTTGRFIIWVRGWNEYTARPGNCDSIFIGFRPEGSTTVNPLIVQAPTATTVDNSQMSGWGAAGWDWRSDRGSGSDPFAFTNSTPGVHTFIIYSREDGTLIDKIVLEPGSRAAGNSAEPATASNNGGHGDGETWDWAMAPTQPTVSISSPANNQLFANGSSILVTADTTAGAPIEKVEFLRATYVMGYFVGATVVATDTTAPFEFTDPNVPEGIYQYTARVTDSIGYVVSSTAGVRVVVDSTKPVASEVGCLGGNIIGVLFKDTVGLDPASATNIANYTVNNGAVQVANATLEHDGETVLLTLASAISGNYTVLVQNVADLGFGPNVVNPTTLNGTVITSWMHQDVGVLSTNDPPVFTNPLLPGEAFAMSEKDFYVRAGGADIWGNADGMHFVYRQVTGDFDIQGRVELITRPNEWSKAVLMAREDLEGGSRNVAILVAPPGGTPLGQDLWNAQERVDKNGVSTSLATALRPLHPPYPNAWMRLVREAGTFSFFWSTNGTEWTQFHTNTPAVAYPDTLYVGFGATSHDNGGTPADLVKVLFRDVTLTTTTQPPAPPTLSVARVGQALEISWTSESSAFVLE
ncbi:MAG TPA: PA14 domain-containing protein, partial [Verrucomicrobiota bacterium]|nr:PA14 domain-containing protein [Verrucomicrobiota bacterium]